MIITYSVGDSDVLSVALSTGARVTSLPDHLQVQRSYRTDIALSPSYDLAPLADSSATSSGMSQAYVRTRVICQPDKLY